MTINDFMQSELEVLAQKSGLDKTRWSKYFNGHLISEMVLNQAARNLDMQPHELLMGINKRRLQNNATNARVKLVA